MKKFFCSKKLEIRCEIFNGVHNGQYEIGEKAYK